MEEKLYILRLWSDRRVEEGCTHDDSFRDAEATLSASQCDQRSSNDHSRYGTESIMMVWTAADNVRRNVASRPDFLP